MSHYIYKCFDCESEYSPIGIENSNKYLCPKCGSAKKNQPLKGVLRVLYDYSEFKLKIKRKRFLKFSPGIFQQYYQLWPLKFFKCGSTITFDGLKDSHFDKTLLNSYPTSLLEYQGESLFVFDDTRNPTLSFKDRASILVALKALQLGRTDIAAASTGNAGSSLAGICARLGLNSHLFVPEMIPTSKRIQIQSFGANLYTVKGDYDNAFDLCTEITEAKGWYNRNTAYNPLTIEGKKSAAYDMFLSMDGKLPDFIFIPVGDGVIIAGIYKGLWELKELGYIREIPKLVAVQSNKSDGVVRFMESGKFEYKPANSIADSLNAGAPRNLYMAANAVKESNGESVSVTDDEILIAQKEIAQKWGMLVEPAAAATLAGYKKMKASGQFNSEFKIMLLFTGNGLKDISSLEKSNPVPEIKSPTEWKNELLLKNRLIS